MSTVNVIRSDQAAIEYAQKLVLEFAQQAAERDQQRELPHRELQRLSESGLLGITVPFTVQRSSHVEFVCRTF